MYVFSKNSLSRLQTLDPDLARVITTAMNFQVMDFAILCGMRTVQEQEVLFKTGKSRTLKSKHLPNRNNQSEAIDVAPWPVDWNDHCGFHRLAGVIQAAAAIENVPLRWGGDWDRDNDTRDQSFIDLPHFELFRPFL